MPETPSASSPDGMLQADVVRDGQTSTLVLAGELDLSVIDIARERLAEARDGDHSQVVVDLSQLTFVDSTGIAFLVEAVKTDGDHHLSFVPSKAYAVQRVLSVTGVAGMLDGARTETSETLSEG